MILKREYRKQDAGETTKTNAKCKTQSSKQQLKTKNIPPPNPFFETCFMLYTFILHFSFYALCFLPSQLTACYSLLFRIWESEFEIAEEVARSKKR